MAASIRRTTVIRSSGDWASHKKNKAIREVVEALTAELASDLKATSLTVTTKPGRYVGDVKVEARLSMGDR